MEETGAQAADEKTQIILEAIREKKGHDIVRIDLREVEHAICDQFVICHGESVTQVSAIADAIERKLKTEAHIRPHHVEGQQNCQWVLLDYFDVLVHVFLADHRSFYKLEDLWADGKRVHEVENVKK